MRKTDEIKRTIIKDLLGNSTMYFEQGYECPKLGNRKIIAVSPKQLIFMASTKSLMSLKRNELLMVESELKKYIEYKKHI